MSIHEFRVRAVNRFVLTEFRKDPTSSSSETIAELPNAQLADSLGEALQRANPGSSLTKSDGEHAAATSLEFVIVEAHTFVPGALVYYAYNEQEAVITQTNAQMMHGREFKVFQRQRPANALASQVSGLGFVVAEPEMPHTDYPSRYSINQMAMRCAVDIAQTGVGQHGILHHYEAEPAQVVGIHFYEGKVCYDVTYPSGRHGETVDSVELSDTPPAGVSGSAGT